MDLELDDFDRIARDVPHLVDVRPAGRFVMSDLDRVGGVPVVMKELLDHGLLHGDCITVTGKTHRREPRGAGAARSPTARSCARSTGRCTRGAAPRSCAATSRPTAR